MQLLQYIQSDKFGTQGGESKEFTSKVEEFIKKLEAENDAIQNENKQIEKYND